jgi:protein O-GlcNAc transferase
MISTFYCHGQKIQISSPDDDHIINKIEKTHRFYEFPTLLNIAHNHTDELIGKNMIDVGAHMGNHTVYFSKFCLPNKVYSFEPNPVVFPYLEENIKLNNLQNVEAFNVGLYSRETNGNLETPDTTNIGHSIIKESMDGGIKLKTLDSYNFDNVGLVKIDVEGNELEVMRGAINTLRVYKPILIVESDPQNKGLLSIFVDKLGYKYAFTVGNNYFFTVKK